MHRPHNNAQEDDLKSMEEHPAYRQFCSLALLEDEDERARAEIRCQDVRDDPVVQLMARARRHLLRCAS